MLFIFDRVAVTAPGATLISDSIAMAIPSVCPIYLRQGCHGNAQCPELVLFICDGVAIAMLKICVI